MRTLTLLLGATVGASAAVAADLYLADKGYRLPDSLPLVGGMTVEPGLMGAIGLGIVASIAPGLAGVAVPLAIGATAFEGAKIASTKLIPHPQLTPPADPNAQVAGWGGFALNAGPKGSSFGSYDHVSDAELDRAMAQLQ